MPQLNWNETEFLDFFGVVPAAEEDACSFDYEIERDGLRLLFAVWSYESVIQVSLLRCDSQTTLYTFAAYVRGAARLIDDNRGRYLELEDCIIAPNRFWYLQSGNIFDTARFPHSVNITIAIDPDIQVAFVNHESRT